MEGTNSGQEVDLIDFSESLPTPSLSKKLQESNSSPVSSTSSTSSYSKKQVQNEAKKKLFIKIDINKVIVNTKEKKEYTLSCYSRGDSIALLIKYQRSEISLCIFGFKNELVIPFDQVKGIKVNESKVLEINVAYEFRRVYHVHSDGFPYNAAPKVSNNDPTSGIFARAVGFKMYPKDWEHENTIAVVEAGLNSLCFTNLGRENELSNSELLFDEEELPEIILAEGEVGFICTFRGTKQPLSFPCDGTFGEFLDVIRENFDYSPEWVEYLDPMIGERITVVDDQDWILAKSVNIRMKKRPQDAFIKIYLS